MLTPLSRSPAFILILSLLPRLFASDELAQAAARGDTLRIRELVAAGTAVDSRDPGGKTALMSAAAENNFGALRELLRLGADAMLKTSEGQTAVALVKEDGTDARACKLLLRAYAFIKTNGRPAARAPVRPHLVLLFEPTVNYLHPRIKERYYVNQAELDGKPGEDDDKNGFVDDIYGWNLDANAPHQINPLQFQIYLQSRETIAKLFTAYNDHRTGKISAAAYAEIRKGYENPLAQIFGRGSGFTNGDFLDRAVDLSHGSHVAGIVIEHSRAKALVHTLSWESFGDNHSLTTPRPYHELADEARDVNDFLARVRAEILRESTARGRRLSDYVRASGAGIVNMSMGANFSSFAQKAQQLASEYLAASGRKVRGPEVEALRRQLPEIAFECYVADAVRFIIPMFENPDVLFVLAAGNDGEDNDETYQSPAYLARFMPNAITVAAVDSDNVETDFSNFGQLSVDLGAPGADIMSTVIPESAVLMDGTSMAAPAVAGAAAYLRAERPELKAAELKKFLLYSAKKLTPLAGRVSTGGVLDETELFKFAGDHHARVAALAAAAITAALADQVALPERLADSEALSRAAIQADAKDAEAWRARAAYFDLKGAPEEAVEPIERATELAPERWQVWNSRALIFTSLKNARETIVSLTRVLALTENDSSFPVGRRARLHAARAEQHLAQGDRDAARADAIAARRLDENIKFGDELAALLE